MPYHHIKAPSQRELSPKVTEGVTQNTPASVPFSSIPALPVSTTPSVTAAPRHFPLGGRLFGTATSKAPSLRGLSPSGDWGSYPKYSCISAFFINSNFSRLCCPTPSVTANAVPPPSKREAFALPPHKGSLPEGAVTEGD